MIDTKAIEEHIRGILIALGDDPNREGLLETPQRVAKMYEEVFEGMNYSNKEIAEKLNIGQSTVKMHITNMLQKAGFHSRLELALMARHYGIAIYDKD